MSAKLVMALTWTLFAPGPGVCETDRNGLTWVACFVPGSESAAALNEDPTLNVFIDVLHGYAGEPAAEQAQRDCAQRLGVTAGEEQEVTFVRLATCPAPAGAPSLDELQPLPPPEVRPSPPPAASSVTSSERTDRTADPYAQTWRCDTLPWLTVLVRMGVAALLAVPLAFLATLIAWWFKRGPPWCYVGSLLGALPLLSVSVLGGRFFLQMGAPLVLHVFVLLCWVVLLALGAKQARLMRIPAFVGAPLFALDVLLIGIAWALGTGLLQGLLPVSALNPCRASVTYYTAHAFTITLLLFWVVLQFRWTLAAARETVRSERMEDEG